MATVTRWPTCLRLPAGGVDLMLPAAVVEQVMSCESLPLSADAGPGWQEVGTSSSGTVLRMRFVPEQGEPREGWTATWLALLRRGPGERRRALLLSDAPELLPPLDGAIELARDAPGAGAVARVMLGERCLVVPDMAPLGTPGAAA